MYVERKAHVNVNDAGKAVSPSKFPRDAAVRASSEDESIPDDLRGDLGEDDTRARCPWRDLEEGDDEDYDSLRRGEWQGEVQLDSAEF